MAASTTPPAVCEPGPARLVDLEVKGAGSAAVHVFMLWCFYFGVQRGRCAQVGSTRPVGAHDRITEIAGGASLW